MRKSDLERAADASQYGKGLLAAKPTPIEQLHEHNTSIRTATYRRHEIVLRTSYELSIDGKPLNVHISVDDNGNVLCHAIPNYAFASGLDMARQLIDAYPDDFPRMTARPASRDSTGHEHGGH